MVLIAVVRMVLIAVVRMVLIALVRMVPIAELGMASIAIVGMFSMSAAAQQPAPTQPPAQPGTVTQTPGQPQPPGQPPGAQPPASTPAPQPRVFTAPAGLIFNTVRPDRVDDFEKAMGYLQAALASSTNERVREQAAGWRVFKATEAGPNNAVLYVFMLDPTVPGADYSLGRILADAYPDQAKLQEIWKLYSGSVTGGSLLNLTPLKPAAPLKTPNP
jgi:hypothetical protein